MHTVTFRTRDYLKTTQSWWAQWHGNAINARLLSDFGVAVLDDTGPIAIAYLYPPRGSAVCYLGFTIREPSLSPIVAGRAIKLLLPAAEDYAKYLGYNVLHAAYDAAAMCKLCEQRGYFKASQVQEYFKELL